jgi:hypothetical protein
MFSLEYHEANCSLASNYNVVHFYGLWYETDPTVVDINRVGQLHLFPIL